VNFDLSKKIGRHTLAGGYEFRQEHYRILSGEPASYILGTDNNYAYGAKAFQGLVPKTQLRPAARHTHYMAT
jgi:iron complex outermembrane receptor protein